MLAVDIGFPEIMIIGGMALFVIGVIQMAVKRLKGGDRLMLILGAVLLAPGAIVFGLTRKDDIILAISGIAVLVGALLVLVAVLHYVVKAKAAARQAQADAEKAGPVEGEES